MAFHEVVRDVESLDPLVEDVILHLVNRTDLVAKPLLSDAQPLEADRIGDQSPVRISEQSPGILNQAARSRHLKDLLLVKGTRTSATTANDRPNVESVVTDRTASNSDQRLVGGQLA